jgi:hypothetical protein
MDPEMVLFLARHGYVPTSRAVRRFAESLALKDHDVLAFWVHLFRGPLAAEMPALEAAARAKNLESITRLLDS